MIQLISFSNKVKKQIIQSGSQDESCIEAETYGLLLFSRLLDPHRNIFRTSQSCVARHTAERIAACCGVYVNLILPPDESAGRNSCVVEIPHIEQKLAINGRFGRDCEQIDRNFIVDESSLCAFLRGAFLASGTVSDPSKSFHLEFSAHNPAICAELSDIMREAGLNSRTLERKTGCSAYIKGSADIESLLGMLGASGAYMDVIEARINREVNNKANRTTNCDAANITKTVTAAGQQLEAIRKIERTAGLGSLPDELRQLAQLRLEQPESTLRELGESLCPPLSRSGVNHRLQKLIDIARNITE